MTTSQQQELSPAEKHRRAQLYARLTYAAVIVTFLSVCTVAVVTTMNNERNKEGFKAIHVTKPISFIDYTYVDQKPGEQAQKP